MRMKTHFLTYFGMSDDSSNLVCLKRPFFGSWMKNRQMGLYKAITNMVVYGPYDMYAVLVVIFEKIHVT